MTNHRTTTSAIVTILAACLSACFAAPDLHRSQFVEAPSASVGSSNATGFPHRVNAGNDGTSYEPCGAIDQRALALLGVEGSSGRDAAVVDRQTARGCVWTYSDSKNWAVTQIVGNVRSLDSYKAKQKEFIWRADLIVDGRRVGVSEMSSSICSTHVQSGRAAISTIAQYDSLPTPPIDEICSRAIAFTRATIDKMPR